MRFVCSVCFVVWYMRSATVCKYKAYVATGKHRFTLILPLHTFAHLKMSRQTVVFLLCASSYAAGSVSDIIHMYHMYGICPYMQKCAITNGEKHTRSSSFMHL